MISFLYFSRNYLLPFCYALFLQESDQIKSIVAISRLEPPKPSFSALTKFKIAYVALWEMAYFPPYNPYATDAAL